MSDNGGLPVDEVLLAIRREQPTLRIEEMDDDFWIFSHGSVVEVARREAIEVHIETYPGGSPPYLIESTGHNERRDDFRSPGG
jgi:hypothetical protein